MSTEHSDERLDDLIHAALGRHRPAFDFQRWQQEHRDRIDVFRSQVKQPDSPVIARTERMFTITRTLKIAAAAVILVAVLVIMSDWMRMTAPAFGLDEISKAMKQVEWSHFVLKIEELNLAAETAMGKRPDGWESWTSRHPPRRIEKHADGRIFCMEQDTGRVSRYDPKSNVIVVEQGSPASPEDLQMSVIERLEKELANAEKQGAKVEYGKGVYEGRPATTITLDYHPPGQMRNVLSMIVDPDTCLLRRLTWKQTHPEKGWRAVASGVADYPDSGPTDIYEAGAPRNARVLVADPAASRSEPDAQTLEVLGRYDAARERLPKQWTLIAVKTEADDTIRDVTIVYVDNQKERWECRYLPYGQTRASADTIPISKGFKAIQEWAHAQEYSRLVKSLCDGRYKQNISYYDGAWHVEDKIELDRSYGFSGEGLYWLGWPKVGGRLIENAYAAQRGLVCIETFSHANVQQGKLIEPAQRTLYYLAPSRDYMCMRREIYQYRVPPGQLHPRVTEVEFDPYSTPSEPTSVREVVEYGRLETGQPYPVALREGSASWNDKNGQWELGQETTLTRVYIQTHPEFREGLFDPNYPGWVP